MNTKKMSFALIRVVAVLLLSTILVVLSGANPVTAVKTFVFGIFGTTHGFAEVFVRATPLMLLGLGVAITFRAGFLNLGAEGQLYMGALASTAAALLLPESLGALRMLIAILVAFLAGGLWVLLPAWMKVWNLRDRKYHHVQLHRNYDCGYLYPRRSSGSGQLSAAKRTHP